MKIISDFGKALETMSKEIEKVPIWFYWTAAAIVLVFIILYFFVFPRLEMDLEKKEKYRKGCICGILILYIISIFVVTVFTREISEEYRIQMVPLDGLWKAEHLGRAAVRDLLNLVFFVPMGFLAAWFSKGRWRIFKSIGASVLLSVTVEACQLAGRYGTFDVDDILFNTLGGLTGALILLGWKYAFDKKSIGRYCMRGIMVICSFVILCGVGCLGAYHFLRISGAEAVKGNISTVENRMESRDTENKIITSDPDLIWHNGKAYRYNDNLLTILFMGIDQRSEVIEKREGVSGESGQADTIFLLVMDQTKNKMNIIGISRDTMTDIKTFDYKGNYLGQSKNHLGLAYAFGDGKETSCQYMVDAVSNLFYGIPINAYAALNMESVITINDGVGGVPVYVEEDLTRADSGLIKGETVTLKGRQALMYMKWRDTSVPNSNNSRIIRQKQYIVNFMKQAIQAVKNDVTLPVTLYQSLTDEMVTDIGIDQAVYLVTKALSMPLDSSGIMMLKGDSVQGSVYDEVYVDDDALYELILNVFYTEENIEGGGE